MRDTHLKDLLEQAGYTWGLGGERVFWLTGLGLRAQLVDLLSSVPLPEPGGPVVADVGEDGDCEIIDVVFDGELEGGEDGVCDVNFVR